MRPGARPQAGLVVVSAAEAPAVNASAALNLGMRRILEGLGYEVHAVALRTQPSPGHRVPLEVHADLAALRRLPKLDVLLVCDGALPALHTGLVEADRTIVFFHGAQVNALSWSGDCPADALCANSPWLRDVLGTIIGAPDWSAGAPHARATLDKLCAVTPALPVLEDPMGSTYGPAASPALWARLDDTDLVIGVDCQRESMIGTSVAVVVALNERLPSDRSARLVITRAQRERLQGVLGFGGPEADFVLPRLERSARHVEDHLVVLPAHGVRQSDFFRVLRRASFCLAFHDAPESFGLQPLECLHLGVPVYGNGMGNVRRLVPEAHGSIWNPDLLAFDRDRIEAMADRIAADLTPGSEAKAAIEAEVEAGARYVRATYTMERFGEELGRVIRGEVSPPAEYRLALGALVARCDATRVLTDRGPVPTSIEERRVLDRVVGRTIAELAPEDRATVERFFRFGVLGYATSG